jgi:uncharacterized membrane protein
VYENRAESVQNTKGRSGIMNDVQVYGGAAVLGAVSGMRSMAAPAIVSKLAHSGLLPLEESQIRFLQHKNSARTMAVMALTEMVADKLPFIPNRTKVFPLVTRAVSGAVSGMAFASAKKRPAALGALFGVLAAVGATYGAFKIRQMTTERLHVPDTLVAVAEDALVAGSAYLVWKSLNTKETTSEGLGLS